eukprot:m.52491 g.52491  ORF g.52491 m.52491 type:complete len:180 (+) comp16542_c0_seq1:17-556(+)
MAVEEKDGVDEAPPKTVHELALCGDVDTFNAIVGVLKKDEKVQLVGERNVRGLSPLEIAATWGHVELVEAALGYGAVTSDKNTLGYTALHRAAMWGRVKCVAVLARQETLEGPVDLELRTEPSVEHPEGETAAEVAMRYQQVATAAEIAAVVEERQAEEARLSEEAEAKSRKSNNKKKK